MFTDNVNCEYFVYDEHVTLKVNDRSDTRLDKQEMFKKVLLSSSPPGTLPAFCFKHQNIRTSGSDQDQFDSGYFQKIPISYPSQVFRESNIRAKY
ncbi:MAG: hypothetical protein WCF23_20370 [Candidatus Nitrosopolaris sp.]